MTPNFVSSSVYVAFALTILVSYGSGFVTSYNLFFFPRYQNENTQAFFMVVSSSRWLSVRLDLLSIVFITAVAVAAILASENPGQLVKAIMLAIIERYIMKYLYGKISWAPNEPGF